MKALTKNQKKEMFLQLLVSRLSANDLSDISMKDIRKFAKDHGLKSKSRSKKDLVRRIIRETGKDKGYKQAKKISKAKGHRK